MLPLLSSWRGQNRPKRLQNGPFFVTCSLRLERRSSLRSMSTGKFGAHFPTQDGAERIPFTLCIMHQDAFRTSGAEKMDDAVPVLLRASLTNPSKPTCKGSMVRRSLTPSGVQWRLSKTGGSTHHDVPGLQACMRTCPTLPMRYKRTTESRHFEGRH